MQQAKCKISRRLGVNLYQKCSKVYSRRPYPPGQKKKKRAPPLSEYGRQLREKQKLRHLYNLKEKPLRNYVKNVLGRGGGVTDAPTDLMRRLELRLDNVVFRLGFAASRQQARQMVSHGHFMVNQKKTTVPSYQVAAGDGISLRPASSGKELFREMNLKLAKYQPPSWLELDKKTLEGKVVGQPAMEDATPPVDLSSVFEFYSR